MGSKTTKKRAGARAAGLAARRSSGAAEALPEGAANPTEVQDKLGHAERAMTRSVKVFSSVPGRQLQCVEIGVREDMMVQADKEGNDALVPLPGPIQKAETARRINGFELAAGEEFILL